MKHVIENNISLLRGLLLQMDVERWVKHLSAARSKADEEIRFEVVDGLVVELNLLSTALSMRYQTVYILFIILLASSIVMLTFCCQTNLMPAIPRKMYLKWYRYQRASIRGGWSWSLS